jgi:hypothetical protein
MMPMPQNIFAARSGALMNRQPVPMNGMPMQPPMAMQGGQPPMQNFTPNPYQQNPVMMNPQVQNIMRMRMGMQ